MPQLKKRKTGPVIATLPQDITRYIYYGFFPRCAACNTLIPLDSDEALRAKHNTTYWKYCSQSCVLLDYDLFWSPNNNRAQLILDGT
jgi:hypothetical protein